MQILPGIDLLITGFGMEASVDSVKLFFSDFLAAHHFYHNFKMKTFAAMMCLKHILVCFSMF